MYTRCNSQLTIFLNDWIHRLLEFERSVQGNGNGIIIFDEVQKVIPGGLDFLSSLLENDGYFEYKDIRYNVGNTIIIFITDIGANDIVKLSLIKSHNGKFEQQMLRNIVKSLMDKHWDELRIGKYVNEVVPFFPLSQSGLEKIMDSKLYEDRIFYVKKKFMSDLLVDARVISHLCSSIFVRYDNYTLSSVDVVSLEGLVDTDDYSRLYASQGARSLLNAGSLYDLRQLIYGHVDQFRDEFMYIGNVCGSGITNFSRQSKTCSLGSRTKIFLAWCSPRLINRKKSGTQGRESVVSKYHYFLATTDVGYDLQNLPGNCVVAWTGSLDERSG